MTDIPATYFDGRTSRPHAVTLRWHALDGVLEVAGEEVALRLARRDVTVESRLGRGPRFIRFADGGRCEVADNDTLDAVIATWAPQHGGNWLHRLETSWRLVAVAVVVLGAAMWAAIHHGLPWGAKKVAFMLPAEFTRVLGDQTLEALDRAMLAPTTLTHERQIKLRADFAAFLQAAGDTTPYQIEFRALKGQGANAFALPSGTIVISDELVLLAEDDREIVAVLAHECAHVRHRHVLRAVLQNSAVVVAFALVTGDASSTAAFGGAVPTWLLQSKFSREFEREADADAVEKLRAAGLDPAHLATMLGRLSSAHGDDKLALPEYARSHPPTQERINAIKGAR
ncbi:MAG: M48 family metallopeptidase [Opitutaceae bacterium]|nr:M48 family metallopeptidase [Opitutaceae bacterium]